MVRVQSRKRAVFDANVFSGPQAAVDVDTQVPTKPERATAVRLAEPRIERLEAASPCDARPVSKQVPRDAAAGRPKASFAELDAGRDPADWPAATAATAVPVAASHEATQWRRWIVALAGAAVAAITVYLMAAEAPPSPIVAPRMERQAIAIAPEARDLLSYAAEQEPADGAPKADGPQPTADYDGLYSGPTRADGYPIALMVRITNGIGWGTQSRLDCGTAQVSLTISGAGEVSGLAQIFGPTCLKTDLGIRGRAIDGSLLLRLGNQYLELPKLGD